MIHFKMKVRSYMFINNYLILLRLLDQKLDSRPATFTRIHITPVKYSGTQGQIRMHPNTMNEN